MKKNAKTSAAQKHTPASLPIPPLAAAIAILADPQTEGVSKRFVRAYAAMPLLLAALQKGDPDERWNAIGTISGLETAQQTAERQPDMSAQTHGDGRPKRMEYAIALLNKEDVDLLADLTTPIMDGAFMVGAAYACYLLLNGGAR